MSSARLLSGKAHADALLASLEPLAKKLKPTLVIVQVGDDEPSAAYIKHKIAACEKIGIAYKHLKLDATTTIETLLKTIADLNADTKVTGYILQLPLPEHLWNAFPSITAAFDPAKDVDGFTAQNFGAAGLWSGHEFLPPATAAAVTYLLEKENISVEGMHAVIIGSSNLVGKPLALMLLNRNATVTICHRKTKNLQALAASADLLISAVGKPGLITAEMVKEGAIVIDIGITRENGKLTGDVDFDAIVKKASAITPVPGGVGPLTVAYLLKNVIDAAQS